MGDLLEAPTRANGTALTALVQGYGGIMDIIDRAARDPAVDIVKLEKLLELAERVKARDAKQEFYAAFAAMQTELPIIEEKGRIEINQKNVQKFARWEDINRAIKPVLAKHGFALSFRTAMDETKLAITGILSHCAGHAEETTFPLPLDTSGSKNAVQAYGSSSSYGRRYVAIALLNLASTGDEDDDGNAGGDGTLTDAQLENLFDLMKRVGADPAAFAKYMGVTDVPSIKPKDYDRAIIALNEKGKRASK